MATPLAPTVVTHLFPGLGRELVALLRSLAPDDWGRPTVCAGWSVRDIAAHLFETACRRLAADRDGHPLPAPAAPIRDYAGLVAHLNRLNAEWVAAARRLSPQLLTDLVAWVEPQLAAHFASLDPAASAPFAVAWAGEQESQNWFDAARELTERWHHQQQIRLAVGVPPLSDAETSEAVFDAFLRALPHHYRDVGAGAGTALAVEIRGARSYEYILRREAASWRLLKGRAERAAAAVRLDEEAAWRLLTKSLTGTQARARAAIEGDPRLAEPFFQVLAVMA